MKRALYTVLCANVLFPLHEWLKSHDSVRRVRQLEQSQWWSREELRTAQAERLRRFLVEAAARVPYYGHLFAEYGFTPGAVQGVSDLEGLPFLTKPLIRAHQGELKASGARKLRRYNTGGSSGEPLVFFIGEDRRSHDVAAKWRAMRWWGVDIGDPEIVVWGSPVELGTQDRVRRARDRVLRSELLPAFEMSEAKLDRFVARIRLRRPTMLFGYPSSLALIARYAESKGLAMNDLGIRVAFVTSERLYAHQRDAISRIFGCRVANGYGGRDAGFIAHECPSGSLHLSAEDIIVELVDAAGHPVPVGTPGEVVVTHLASIDFPFIRYRTGDIAVLGEQTCPCGRELPALKEVQGRTTDFVVAQDGTIMHGLALIYVIRDLPGIESFKVIQESLGTTRVLLVPGPGFDSGCVTRIEQGFRQRLGQGIDVCVEIVDRLPAEASGKFRYVVSRVAPEFAVAAG